MRELSCPQCKGYTVQRTRRSFLERWLSLSLYLPLPLSTLPAPLSYVAAWSALHKKTILTAPGRAQDNHGITEWRTTG